MPPETAIHPSSLRRLTQRVWIAVALCLLGCAPAFAAHPALWRAHDADTTVYLFGTIHAMKKGVQWHFPALDKALADSRMLYVEAADVNSKTLRPLIVTYGMDPAHPLSDKLGKNQTAQLKQAITQVGIQGGMTVVNMMKPWLAGISLAAASLLKAGYDPKLGVDKQLQARFEKAGKPVTGLETAKQQILLLGKLPEPVQLQLLQKSLHDYTHADTMLKHLVHAWLHGDTKALAKTIIKQIKDRSPALYQAIILDRNTDWSQQIAKLMETTPGTFFIAVGTGHLVGPDRVQVQLQQQNIHITRLNP